MKGGTKMTEKKKKVSNEDAIMDAIKELTKAVSENTTILTQMKAAHDKWIRAGKF